MHFSAHARADRSRVFVKLPSADVGNDIDNNDIVDVWEHPPVRTPPAPVPVARTPSRLWLPSTWSSW